MFKAFKALLWWLNGTLTIVTFCTSCQKNWQWDNWVINYINYEFAIQVQEKKRRKRRDYTINFVSIFYLFYLPVWLIHGCFVKFNCFTFQYLCINLYRSYASEILLPPCKIQLFNISMFANGNKTRMNFLSLQVFWTFWLIFRFIHFIHFVKNFIVESHKFPVAHSVHWISISFVKVINQQFLSKSNDDVFWWIL